MYESTNKQADTENNFIPRARDYLKLFTLIQNDRAGPGPSMAKKSPFCTLRRTSPEVAQSPCCALGLGKGGAA
jgi:hypothetical protein